MLEEISAYIAYLRKFGKIKKPKMPIFDFNAYTDNEYLNAISVTMKDYENVDDFLVTINYLKGD